MPAELQLQQHAAPRGDGLIVVEMQRQLSHHLRIKRLHGLHYPSEDIGKFGSRFVWLRERGDGHRADDVKVVCEVEEFVPHISIINA